MTGAGLWCEVCQRRGDHLTSQHPESGLIPDCQGYARFDNQAHAEYIMSGVVEEFGGTWCVKKHGEHYHVTEAADA